MTEVSNGEPSSRGKDFFISYHESDLAWAEWIANALENAGYSLTIQAWDFRPGMNLVIEINRAASECKTTIAVLSPDYLASVFTQAEWAAALSSDPTGASGKLVPIRVRMCEPPGLLRQIIACDLLGLAEDAARASLLRAVSGQRNPVRQPPFPDDHVANNSPKIAVTPIQYPGVHPVEEPPKPDPLVEVAIGLLALIKTTRVTFQAQARLRDSLVRSVMERLILNPVHVQFEDFLPKYASQLTSAEQRIFKVMRRFSEAVLFEYNRKALDLIELHPGLKTKVERVSELELHLRLWLEKYLAIFEDDPTLPLLYVGVAEGVPYPRDIEWETWKYIDSTGEANDLLASEGDQDFGSSEHYDSDGDWHYRQHNRWMDMQFSTIKNELFALEGAQVPEALDLQIGELLSQKLATYALTDVIPVQQIIDSTKQLLSAMPPQSRWAGLINSAQAAIDISSEFWTFKSLLPLLPSLARVNSELGTPTPLGDLWIEARQSLLDRLGG
ncbi:toll/interleukin-1 receptor domain-containing protein [Rhizobium johnstonii]|uniref:TIR domain family protein n=1 Tax=Rhizobium leguminosarum TaxID=384 RepID=A0A2Z4YGX4_RHILE|nr:toll/interleukin-1 receptor domain-containing protein [Rhizobium leguminosarum]AXA39443.1 TIR domain family protein [Rhizobium leguminosarum]